MSNDGNLLTFWEVSRWGRVCTVYPAPCFLRSCSGCISQQKGAPSSFAASIPPHHRLHSQNYPSRSAGLRVSVPTAGTKNRPNQEILVCDWLNTSHVTRITASDWLTSALFCVGEADLSPGPPPCGTCIRVETHTIVRC